ncbi:MAG: hypothetical protein R3D51_17705 [Hyphomicrobiaceae bacterium]
MRARAHSSRATSPLHAHHPWNNPGDIQRALDAVSHAVTDQAKAATYDQILYSIGNNHAGTYYPVALTVLPEFDCILLRGSLAACEIVLDVLIELVTSFAPEPGFEYYTDDTGIETDLAEAMKRGVSARIPAIRTRLPTFPIGSRAARIAIELLDWLEDNRPQA